MTSTKLSQHALLKAKLQTCEHSIEKFVARAIVGVRRVFTRLNNRLQNIIPKRLRNIAILQHGYINIGEWINWSIQQLEHQKRERERSIRVLQRLSNIAKLCAKNISNISITGTMIDTRRIGSGTIGEVSNIANNFPNGHCSQIESCPMCSCCLLSLRTSYLIPFLEFF